MPADAITILNGLKELFETLPAYIYIEDWEKAKLYYKTQIERIRAEKKHLEEEVESIERRVSLIKNDIVTLENA